MNATATAPRKTTAMVTPAEQEWAKLDLIAYSEQVNAEATGEQWAKDRAEAARAKADRAKADRAWSLLSRTERTKLGAPIPMTKAERVAAKLTDGERAQLAEWEDRLSTLTRYPSSARDTEYRGVLTDADGRRIVRYWRTEKGMLTALIRTVRNGGAVHDVF
jgi:hypothetical protein